MTSRVAVRCHSPAQRCDLDNAATLPLCVRQRGQSSPAENQQHPKLKPAEAAVTPDIVCSDSSV